MLIYSSGVDSFSTDGQQLFLGSSTHNAQVQRQLRPLSRATKTSVFFHGADTTVVLRARNTGDAPGIVQARKSDGPESTNGTVEKCLEHQSSAKQTSITSRVRATGIQFPINDGMTIPLYGKTFHVLTIAHITTNNDKEGNC